MSDGSVAPRWDAAEVAAKPRWWEVELADFARMLAGSVLARRTQETYVERAGAFLRWLETAWPVREQALSTEAGRDEAVEQFLAHLRGRALAPSTLNVTRAALDSYYRWRALESPAAAAAAVVRGEPLALSARQRSQVLDIAAQSLPRDNALVVLGLATGLRESELAGLDLDDVVLHAETGTVHAPGPDPASSRVLDLDPATRRVLLTWLAARRAQLGLRRRPAAFFLGRSGDRLSTRRIDEIVRDVGRRAGLPLELSPGVLRNTFERDLREQGTPAAQINYLMGRRHRDRGTLGRSGAGRIVGARPHPEQLRLL